MEKSWRMSSKEDKFNFRELGNQRFQAGDFTEAIKLYTKGLCEDPAPSDTESAILYQNRAAAYEKKGGETAQVVEDCSKALKRNQRYVKAYGRRGRAYDRLGEHQKAVDDLMAASMLSQQPDSNDWTQCLSESLKKLAKQKAREAMMDRIRAVKLLPLSTTLLESFLTGFFEDPVLTLIHTTGIPKEHHKSCGLSEVFALLEKKRFEEAMEACGRVQGEAEADARLLRATFAYLTFNFPLVREDLRALFPLLESMADKEKARRMKVSAYIKLALVHMTESNKEASLGYFCRAEATDLQNVDVFYHRGVFLVYINLEDAKADFDQCIQLQPDWPLPRVQLYNVEYLLAKKKGNSLEAQSAIGRLEQLICQFPTCYKAYNMLNRIYFESSDFVKNQELLEKESKQFPTSPYTFLFKGRMEIEQSGNVAKAIKLVKKALEIDPNFGTGYMGLSSFETLRGNLKKALEYVERGLEVAHAEEVLALMFFEHSRLVVQMKVSSELF